MRNPFIVTIVGLAAFMLLALAGSEVLAGAVGDPLPGALGDNAPLPANFNDFVKDKDAATRLGKALFWEMQVGGDGQVACATCHFSAGVDARIKNTVHPGKNGKFNVVTGADDTLTLDLFPFVSDDIVGSQGVVRRTFDVLSGLAQDHCTDAPGADLVFFPHRQVTGRNAPNSIMAIFNRLNFWDGRAQRKFNGVTVKNDPSAQIWVKESGRLRLRTVGIDPASQASQEVGPPNNEVEMSCAGRKFAQLARKLFSLTPLGQQTVSSTDSVLGNGKLAGKTYPKMIEDAFHSHFTSNDPIPNSSGFTQKEANFSLFWGLSILAYGSTLLPNNTPFDQCQRSCTQPDPIIGCLNSCDLPDAAKMGAEIFRTKGRCIACHNGPAFTEADITNPNSGKAFVNTGVRPVIEDQGLGKGKFKTPTLRNVELTGPYFHTGNQLTLMQVVDFYNRGGDHRNSETDAQIRPLGLTDSEKDNLVAFMLTLTDEQVRCEKNRFDHPSLDVPNGPDLNAVGVAGLGTCLTPFLGADPFAP